MLSSALLSLGVVSSALAWPDLGHSRHSSVVRAIHARHEPATAKAKKPVSATWFASWHASEFPLASVSWTKYTTVSYGFALTTPDVSSVNISDPEIFKDFVSTAHANNVSAAISIGGWTGSRFFSSAVATAGNRTQFVQTMVKLVKENSLDRLEFDWEYPAADGIGCNTKSPNDIANFLLFLKELRTALPNLTLSTATSIVPWTSADGTPSTNVSEFASVLDYIQIMNYDVWGPWSDTTGPNAPLNDTCAANATQKVGSAVSAIAAWTKAGFPADQIVLGVASYGHGFSVAPTDALQGDSLNPYSKFNKSSTPPGDAWDDAKGTLDVCGNVQAQGGTWNFWGLIKGGFLNENGAANTAGGIAYKYDECSQTPSVYNGSSGVFVAFDNAESFRAKGRFIHSTGLRGFSMWEAGGDYDDILLNAIRSGAGFPEVVDTHGDCEGDETGNSGSYNSGGGSYSGGNSSNNSGSYGSSNQGSTPNPYNGGYGNGNTPPAQPTSTHGSGDDDECKDHGYTGTTNTAYSAPSVPSVPTPSGPNAHTKPPPSAAQPTATPEPSGGYSGGDDDECEDESTSGTTPTNSPGYAPPSPASKPAHTPAPAPTGSAAAPYAEPIAPTASEGYGNGNGYKPPSTPAPAHSPESSICAAPTQTSSPASTPPAPVPTYKN